MNALTISSAHVGLLLTRAHIRLPLACTYVRLSRSSRDVGLPLTCSKLLVSFADRRVNVGVYVLVNDGVVELTELGLLQATDSFVVSLHLVECLPHFNFLLKLLKLPPEVPPPISSHLVQLSPMEVADRVELQLLVLDESQIQELFLCFVSKGFLVLGLSLHVLLPVAEHSFSQSGAAEEISVVEFSLGNHVCFKGEESIRSECQVIVLDRKLLQDHVLCPVRQAEGGFSGW